MPETSWADVAVLGIILLTVVAWHYINRRWP